MRSTLLESTDLYEIVEVVACLTDNDNTGGE